MPPFLSLLLCAVLALAVTTGASAAEQRPTELWDEFPLEPSATPTAVASPSQPSDRASERAAPTPAQSDGGDIDTGMLVLIMLAATTVGGLTATAIARRILPRGRRTRPSAKPAAAAPTPMAAKPAAAAPTPVAAQPAASPPAAQTAPQPPVQTAPPPPAEPANANACRIALQTRARVARFNAVPESGGRVLAHSPDFRLGRDPGDPDLSPLEALDALVEQLEAAGWSRTGSGPKPWDLHFEQALQPAARERSG